VRATSGFIRLFIRGLAWDATESGSSFADALKTAARARLTDSSRGKVLVGTGMAGATVNYSLPPLGDLTGADLAEVCSTLLDQVDALKTATPAITDSNLVAGLLAKFPVGPAPRSVRTFRPDFSVGLCR
jgi:hypothetical protein